MSERFIRCAHCGLPHDAHVVVCPTTGLRIDNQNRPRRRATNAPREVVAEQRRMVGQIIDRKYRVIDAIGEGGMSSIYEAEQLGVGRRVALKVLHPGLAEDPEAIARLRNEAKVVSAIGHPNICEVLDMGRTERGSAYLVMELLTGESLAERIKDRGALPFAELGPLVRQVLEALEAAHAKGILHRDLKPENVFIEASSRHARSTAKLLDFGISKSMTFDFMGNERLTHTGMVMGTPYYMAPEQARGDSGLDQRVDLWAIGVIMYEALTGRRPFVATNYNALLVKILTSRPRPVQKITATIPDTVATIIDRALSKLREDRFQSAVEFREAIAAAEREHAEEDPHAPTLMMRRVPRSMASTRQDVRVSEWGIEDPSTYIDDPSDPGQQIAPDRFSRPRMSDPLPLVTRTGGFVGAPPLEDTIQERLPDYDELVAAGVVDERPTEAGWSDETEVLDRDVLYDDFGRDAPPVIAPAGGPVVASRPPEPPPPRPWNASFEPPTRPHAPRPPAPQQRHETQQHHRPPAAASRPRQGAPQPRSRPASQPPPPPARQAPGPAGRATPGQTGRPPPMPPGPRPRRSNPAPPHVATGIGPPARQPPAKPAGPARPPRPSEPDDDEPTTLFDIEAARARLAARNKSGTKPGEGD